MLPHASPEDIDLDPRSLARADELLRTWTAGPEPAISGASYAVGRHGKLCPPRYFGRLGPAADAAALGPDAVFLMASITKPVVYMTALMLVERGLLNLSDRVTRYFPEFAAHHKENTLVLHLFTHTSGLPDMLPDNLELRRQHAPLATFLDKAIRETVPLFPPGTQVSYQSMGTLVVAGIVEQLTGEKLPAILAREWFEPLGMQSTRLGSAGLDHERIVRVEVPEYQQGGEDYDWNSRYWRELGSPWGGMFSSAEDFAVLCQMLLAGGTYGGRRYLSRATVERMTTNRLDDLPDLPEGVRRTQPWGLGWRLNHPGTDDSCGDLLSPRAFGHTGATGTMVWIDPEKDGFCVLLTNALRASAPGRLVQLSNVLAAAFV